MDKMAKIVAQKAFQKVASEEVLKLLERILRKIDSERGRAVEVEDMGDYVWGVFRDWDLPKDPWQMDEYDYRDLVEKRLTLHKRALSALERLPGVKQVSLAVGDKNYIEVDVFFS